MIFTAPGAVDGGLLPARPLAAQAHALHAAAAFIEHAGIPGLSLTIDDERITIQVWISRGIPPCLIAPWSITYPMRRNARRAGSAGEAWK